METKNKGNHAKRLPKINYIKFSVPGKPFWEISPKLAAEFASSLLAGKLQVCGHADRVCSYYAFNCCGYSVLSGEGDRCPFVEPPGTPEREDQPELPFGEEP